MSRQPWRFSGSKTEYFFLYAAGSVVTAVVCVAAGERTVGVLFLGLAVFFGVGAWRAWTRREP